MYKLPEDFIFGGATAAYQVESSTKEGGKGAYGSGGSRNGSGPGGLLCGGRSGGQLSCDSLGDGGEMGSGILCENPFKWIFILL